ncbi:FxsA family protein [Roseospira goensis]|uniref:UPF0716 protein FxsA n=1 Tax=Roseospira goensis TaxID=391922 RepID=A0A7W6S1E1_9PROT|nr:FxsA family protein [Roseospira goensis]MBB4286407.1 UPF0716 protein FxsA [Roseospira goensis]
MPFLLLIAFIGVPLLEIAVFIQVGGVIGLGWTLVLVVLTAVAGTLLLRAQGLSTLNRARASLDRGEVPMREVFDGACLLVGGALLLTPGFVTDTVGFLLLLPPVRGALLERLKASGRFSVQVSGFDGGGPGGPGGPGRPGGPGAPGGSGARGRGPVIEGEYEEVGPPRPSRWGGVGQASGPEADADGDADRAAPGSEDSDRRA